MSRSRRKRKLEKCICGRHLIPWGDGSGFACTILQYVDEFNEMLRKFRRAREMMRSEED